MTSASLPLPRAPRAAAPIQSTPRNFEWGWTVPFIGVHVAALASFWVGITWQAAVLCAVLWAVRMFAVTAGYHRYFSHRTYKTSRVFQFLLAVLAQSSSQRGVLWWAAHHRHHHKVSDEPGDIHSPRQDGFWYSHIGWVYNHNSDTDMERVRDLAKYPELRWLNTFWIVPPIALGFLSWLSFGWSGLFFGFFMSTALLYHATFTINSLAHVYGSRRYDTTDDSKNNFWLALLTFGEGWHNNHHHYMHSARQGFFWWEIDVTYYVLRALSWVGIVWDLKPVPEKALRACATRADL